MLSVLGGTSIDVAAARACLSPRCLKDAVALYRSAGWAALDACQRPDWYQVQVQFSDWHAAEHAVVTGLWPHLRQAESDGLISAWWFVRKSPCWRFRVRPGPSTSTDSVRALMSSALDAMVTADAAVGWRESIYEPETYAFGGPVGMEVAHRLFHADSRALLDHAGRRIEGAPKYPSLGRRELSLLLLSALMRGAGLEWAEQGDVWRRVEQSRPVPSDALGEQFRVLRPAVRRLLLLDTGATGGLVGVNGPLAEVEGWLRDFSECGKCLGAARDDGELARGIRSVVERLVLFHWNRMGMPSEQQGLLARAAREATLSSDADCTT
ncbi:thiopeptide-type bacteriocin biosynthesis protein [Streptomyces sp. NPDC048057]|uniref:thiopeptide-type bacteriocin biosynthesis protein n=1 Tax=Streptomyces sp. NPDC048057 TaxID=3155628 RepID=UPI0033E55AEE